MFRCRERLTRKFPFRKLAGLSCPILPWAFLQCVLFFLPVLIILQSVDARANGIPWWNLSYGYRQQLTVTNNNSSILSAGYSVCVSLDHSSLFEAGKSLASGNDVRIVYWNGSTDVELDRINESSWNSSGTETRIWFRTQADIAESGNDNNYFVYYGKITAGSPPADRKKIYEFFDDFSDYEIRQYDTSAPDTTDVMKNGDEQVWKIQSGIWNIENDTQADGTTGKVLSHDSFSGLYTYAYVLNRSCDNVLVEVKMRTRNGEYGGYWPFGARLNTSTGASYTAWGYSDYTKMLKFSSWISPSTLIAGSPRGGMVNNWHTFKFTLDGKKLNLYFDGASYGCYVEDTALTSGTIFAMGFGNRKMHFDDFKVRKYTTNEPSVLAGSEEMTLGRPIVSLDKKWHLKGDGHTPTDRYLGVSVSSPEADGMPEAQASYEIPEANISGSLSKVSSTNWQDQVDISGLPTGTFHLVVTVADTAQRCVSDPMVFHVSYPFYHVWTIDWEGSYEPTFPCLDSLAFLADKHGVRMSQLFNPRVYVTPGMPESQRAEMTQWVLERAQTKGDEIGLHLHMYFDYVESAGLTPITTPQWGNRSEGYDVPFADYDYGQSLTLLNFAIGLFQQRGLGTPSSFRAGGWFADEENLRALSDLGFQDDASGSLYKSLGNLPSPWDLSDAVQPYYPCSGDQNTSSCSPGDWNLSVLEIPNSLSNTSGNTDTRPYFDRNYSRAPLDSVRVGVLLSHQGSATGIEGRMLEQYFAYVDSFLYVADRGAVVYATLADVREALFVTRPDPPDLLGPPDLVSGQNIPQCSEAFAFDIHERDSLNLVGYRIQISKTPDYGCEGIVVDYVCGISPQGRFNFTTGQPESTGTYIRGGMGQTLYQGAYYWRVAGVDHKGTYSSWTRAHNGSMAFTIDESYTGVENNPGAGHAVPLAISFCNPSGSGVLLKAQVPVAGKALLRIFNCPGRLVRTMPLDGLRAGASSLYWDGRDAEGRPVSSGVYFIELSQSSRMVTKKLVLVK